jgi:hypothetical protein
MIEHGLVDGKPATIGYFTKDFQPCEKHEADFAKVHFDHGDGPIMLSRLRPPPPGPRRRLT